MRKLNLAYLSDEVSRMKPAAAGRPAVVMGSAPSVATPERSMPDDALRIGLGDLPWRAPELGPYDYWVTANTVWPRPWQRRDRRQVARAPVRCILLSTVAFTNSPVDQAAQDAHRLAERWSNEESPRLVMFESRHLGNTLCSPRAGCCEAAEVMGRPEPIQESLQPLLPGPQYSTGDTVALHGFALAVLLGATPIFLTGIEIPKRSSDYTHIHGDLDPSIWRLRHMARRAVRAIAPAQSNELSVFAPGFTKTLEDFRSITAVAETLGLVVYNTSSTSSLRDVPGIIS